MGRPVIVVDVATLDHGGGGCRRRRGGDGGGGLMASLSGRWFVVDALTADGIL